MNRKLLLFLPVFFLLSACLALSNPPAPSHCITPTCGPCGCPPNTPTDPEEQATLNAIWTMVMGTAQAEATHQALSATPLPTASRTPTITPTGTPRPTSTVWRIEPSVTVVPRQRSIINLNESHSLPDFGIGVRKEWMRAQIQALQQSLLQFLEAHHSKPDVDVDTAFFYVLQSLEADWDRDGQAETALLYALGNFPYQRFGVAIARGEQILQADLQGWRGELANLWELQAIPLSRGKTALFVQLGTATSGSGVYPQRYQRMYFWQQDHLQTIWDWQYSGGGRAGWANSWASSETLRLLHLSGNENYDLLLSRTDSQWLQFDNPANYIFSQVKLPGELLFSWDETTSAYQLTHFYDGARLSRIRPTDFFVPAPRLNQPLMVDGRFYDWYQIEYINQLSGYGLGNFSRSAGILGVHAAFDDSVLYLFVQTYAKTRVWLGFDTDLTGDFETHTLDEDDFVFQIQLSQQDPLSCRIEQAGQVFPQPAALEIVSRPSEYWDAFCLLEIRIPLSDLSLPPGLTTRSGYALRPQLDPLYDRPYAAYHFTEYYPQPGKLIGFAVIGENEPVAQDAPRLGRHYLSWQPQDPTTWGTLLFIADR